MWLPSFSPALLANDEVTGRRTFPDCLIHTYVMAEKLKVKCTLVQALRFCTGRKAHRGSRGIVLLFLEHGTRRG